MKPRFVDSFLYAAQGIRTAVREERNMRFHLCAAFYVYLFRCFTALAKQSTFSSRSWYAGFWRWSLSTPAWSARWSALRRTGT